MLTFAHACAAATLASTMLTLWLWCLARLARVLLLPRVRRFLLVLLARDIPQVFLTWGIVLSALHALRVL